MRLSNSVINKIGDVIRRDDGDNAYKEAVAILNDWREAHGAVLDEFYDRSVELAHRIDSNIMVAQRLKRLPTIIGKLNRFKTMRLSSMQDIAGVRIIANDMTQLEEIDKQLLEWDGLERVDDYIEQPKNSGYRSKHFIFKKDNMFVEVQLRTQIQHLWATSVESTDILRGSKLKEQDDNSYWHDFFCQVSSIFAIAEDAPAIEGFEGKTTDEICEALMSNIGKNRIYSRIMSFALANYEVGNRETDDAYYLVITQKFKERKSIVNEYKEDEYHLAFEEYTKQEQKKDDNQQTVLVVVNQIKKLREAYPNYFMDLAKFVGAIDYILEKLQENDKIKV